MRRSLFGMSLLCACAAVAGIGQAQRAHGQVPPAAVGASTAASVAFDPAEAKAVVEKLTSELEANFVLPEAGNRYAAALRANLKAGRYTRFDSAEAFASAVTNDLQAVHRDGHLKLMAPKSSGAGLRRMAMVPSEKSMVLASGWLAPKVAYISFEMFSGNDATMADLRSFLAKVAGAETLIVDLRKHKGGGMDEMDLMFAQLFARPTALVDMDTRVAAMAQLGDPLADSPTIKRIAGPDGVIRQRHFAVPAAQPALSKTKLYLLTSNYSASAAEHFALALKRTHRATLVGETTRGAGNYGRPLPLGFGYSAFVPMGRTFDPDTNQGWEGSGVTPDVPVPADAALERALALDGVKVDSKLALAKLR